MSAAHPTPPRRDPATEQRVGGGCGASAADRPITAQQKAVWALWEAQLAKLKAYKQKHGDCNVPRRWAEDRSLGGWVDKQRSNKRKLDRGEPGHGMMAERAATLTTLGFAWEPGAANIRAWHASRTGQPRDQLRESNPAARRAGGTNPGESVILHCHRLSLAVIP
jgi:hypothetical protein